MTRQTRSFSLLFSSLLTIFILISFIEIYLPPVLLKPPEWQLLFSGSLQPIYSPDNEIQAVYLLLCFPAFGSEICHLKKARRRCLRTKDRNPGLHGGFPAPAGLAALHLWGSISREMCCGTRDPVGMLLPRPLRASSRPRTWFVAVGQPPRTHGSPLPGCLHASDDLFVTGNKRGVLNPLFARSTSLGNKRIMEINI